MERLEAAPALEAGVTHMTLLPGASQERTPRPFRLSLNVTSTVAKAIDAERQRLAQLTGITPSVSSTVVSILERALVNGK
jgi:hypothetical protein